MGGKARRRLAAAVARDLRRTALAALAAILGLTALFTVSPSALAHGNDSGFEARSADASNPFRGSSLTFDQSMTTQTADVGPAPLSYVPLYQVWLSLRPIYWLDAHWSVRGRFDYFKELTNDEDTTYYREDVFGDIWTDLVYHDELDALWPRSSFTGGLRAVWPTSKASQGEGMYVALGAFGRVAHTFELAGEGAPAFENLQVKIGAWYDHPFTNATTPNAYGNFAYVRENVDGQSFVSDQIQGQTLVANSLVGTLDVGLAVTPKLFVDSNLVFINNWHYRPTDSCVMTSMGCVNVGRPNDEQFTQETWFVFSADYSVMKELDVGVGYYNLANLIAPDGQRRSVFGSDNIWWSPDARFFLDITANIDAILDDALGHRYSSKETGRADRTGPSSGAIR
jgi:hypothetical protein